MTSKEIFVQIAYILRSCRPTNFSPDPKKWEAVNTTNFGNMDITEAKKILNLDEIDDVEILEERTATLLKVTLLPPRYGTDKAPPQWYL